MAANCDPLCTLKIPASYVSAACKPVLRLYGYAKFILKRCNVEFNDVLDAGEWATHIASGDIIMGPEGIFTIGETTTAVIPMSCGKTINEFSDTTWTFTTPMVAKDYSDERFWRKFNDYAGSYELFYIDGCTGDERVFLNNEVIDLIDISQGGGGAAVPASVIGFDLNITKIPQFIAGANGKSGQLVFQGFLQP
jgi:hypothetical protein